MVPKIFNVIIARKTHTPSCTLTFTEWCEKLSSLLYPTRRRGSFVLAPTGLCNPTLSHMTPGVFCDYLVTVCAILSNYMAVQVIEIQVLSEIITFVGWAHKHLLN